MTESADIEELSTKCPYCGEAVISKWAKDGGMLSEPHIALAGDLIFHTVCWNKQLDEHPPVKTESASVKGSLTFGITSGPYDGREERRSERAKINAELFGDGLLGEDLAPKKSGNLAMRFMVPPFTVFSAREGWWQDRKRAWLDLGIKSELGRGENLLALSEQNDEYMNNKTAYLAKLSAAPGGSAMPAMNYKDRQRDSGAGKAVTGTEAGRPSGKSKIVSNVDQGFVRGSRETAEVSQVGILRGPTKPRVQVIHNPPPVSNEAPPWIAPADLPSLAGVKRLAIDTETYDPDLETLGPGFRRNAYIVGLALGTDDGRRFYLPTRHEGGGNLDEGLVKRWAKEELGKFSGELAGASLLYDLDGLATDWDVHMPNVKAFHDVQVAEPLIDEWRDHYTLEAISQDYLGEGKDEALLKQAASVYGASTNKQIKQNIWRMPAAYVGKYAEADVDRPLRILPHQFKKLNDENLNDIYTIERKLIPVLLAMRLRGVRVNVAHAEYVKEQLTFTRDTALAKVRAIAGKSAELMAPESFAHAFQEAPPRTPKTDKPSVTKGWLNAHAADPLATAILEGRAVDYIINTFINGHIFTHSIKGRIHAEFNQLKGEGGGTIARFCLHGSTVLETSAGSVKIEDYEPTGKDMILTHLGRPRRILRKFYKGRDLMYKICLTNGRSVVCTPSHRVLTENGWSSLQNLRAGDKVLSYGYLQTGCSRQNTFSENCADVPIQSTADSVGDANSNRSWICDHRSNADERHISGEVQSRKSLAVLKEQAWSQESDVRKDWQEAPQLQRHHLGWARLPSNENRRSLHPFAHFDLLQSSQNPAPAERVHSAPHRRGPTQQSFRQFGNGYERWAPGFTSETIETIVFMGTDHVWDIEVEEDHSFLAQGFVHHNSSSNPNLQNLPARDDELAPLVRGLFVPEEGEEWQRDDYSQIEYRLLTHFAVGPGSEEARKRYNDDPKTDFHKFCAEIMKVDPESKSVRKKTKGVNFCKVYGGGVPKIALVIGCSFEEAQEFTDLYDRELPFVKKTLETAMYWAGKQGYVTTILGRRQRFPLWEKGGYGENSKPLSREKALEWYGPNIKRYMTYAALNRKNQGSSADITKKAMVDAWEAGLQNVIGAPLVTVHDESGSSIPQTKEGDEAGKELTRIMEKAVELKVPVYVENKRGANWGEVT